MIVYKVTNKVTGQVYIGSTKYSLEHRWKGHMKALYDGGKFHNNILEYGEYNFKKEILQDCSGETEEYLRSREDALIKEYWDLLGEDLMLNAKPRAYGGNDDMSPCNTPEVQARSKATHKKRYGNSFEDSLNSPEGKRNKSEGLKSIYQFRDYPEVKGREEFRAFLKSIGYDLSVQQLKNALNGILTKPVRSKYPDLVESDFQYVKSYKVENKYKEMVNMSKYYKNTGKLKCYLAGPWFNPEQDERNKFIKETFENLDFDAFDPRTANLVPEDADQDWRKTAFEGNIGAIRDADFIIATTDGLDAGTLMECGVAYQAGIPIIYFAETLGDRQFNLMLAQSGIHVILSREQLVDDLANPELLECIKEKKVFKNYEGKIQ